MASISSLSSSSTSSIYGNRNVLSGLASGLDTESMIENSVQGFKLKLSSLQQQRTKVEWKQSAYRSIISKMAGFTQKYTSYTSGTNLLSANFFNSATKVTAMGKYADKVSATGKTNSTVQINSVKSLATAARYSVGAGKLNSSNEASKAFQLNLDNTDKTKNPIMGTLKGSMTVGYGGKEIRLSFSEDDVFENAAAMAAAINEKLEQSSISFDNGGGQVKASERIKAVASDDGTSIEFTTVKEGDDNGVWISGTSGNVGNSDKLNIEIKDSDDKSVKSFNFNSDKVTDNSKSMAQLIAEKGFTITLDGKSKTIKGPTEEEITEAGGDFITALQKKIDADPALKDKLKVENIAADADGEGAIKLKFYSESGSKFQVTSELDKHLGMEGGLTSYVNTSRALKDVIGTDAAAWGAAVKVDVTLTKSADGKSYTDKDGNTYTKKDGTDYYTDKDGNKFVIENDGADIYKANADGEKLYKFTINGQDIEISQEDSLEDLMNAVNSNENAGVTMAYSQFTGKFTFTAKDTGANGKIEFGDGMAKKMFEASVAGDTAAKDLVSGTLKGNTFDFKIDGIDYSYKFKGNSGTLDSIVKRLNNEVLQDTGMTVTGFDKDGSLIVEDQDGNRVEATLTSGQDGTGVAEKLKAGIAAAFEASQKELGVTHTKGTDAVFNVTVNGEVMDVTQGSNTVDIDGMSVTLKNTFTAEKGDEVTFSTSADADKIVDAVKTMVEDYNAMITEIKKAYSTMPLTNSKGKYYEPLTDEDQADMSESAIKSYEEKAKTGLLFGDRDLSGLYTGLTNALNMLGVSGNDAQKLGITTSYSDGTTTLALDESALRASLASDPDKVAEIFTRSTKNGASTDGLMQSLKTQLDKYAATTGASKGLLVEKAGSPLAPTSIYGNTLQKQLDNFDTQITKWQDKLSDKIDYYNKKFTALEKLVAQMNNQSSMLMGLSGGY